MAYEIRQGAARQLIVDGNELDPAEGSELTYRTSGRAGEIHLSGNGNAYGESNPHIGMLSQDVSVNGKIYKKLKAIQNEGRFVSVSCTTAGKELLIGEMAVGGDAIENANGIVSLELHGKLTVQ